MEIKQIKASKTYQLRLQVLKTCAAYTYKYIGDFKSTTIHLAGIKGTNIIAVLSLMQKKHDNFAGQQVQLRGMAVSKENQHQGIGKILINYAVQTAIELQTDLIWCNAREEAISFYSKNGFDTVGKRFFIANVGFHFLMVRKLTFLK